MLVGGNSERSEVARLMESGLNVQHRADCPARRRHWVRWGISFFLLIGLVASGTALCYYVRQEFRRSQCRHNLWEIGLKLWLIQQENGAFPPANVRDEAGKPVNSWRTVIATYQLWYIPPFPSTYDFAKPWNGPENATLLTPQHASAQGHFQCPAAGNEQPTITNYVAVIGENTMWPPDGPGKPAADGSDNEKILVIEVINSDIAWMEPRDLTLEQALDAIQPKKGIGIGSRHRHGIHYVTVGGAVRTLDPNIDRESLRKLLVKGSPGPPQ